MANYRSHLTVSTALGVVYGGAGVTPLGMDTSTAIVGAGLTAIGGLLPDLDSDSGVPIRELFGIAAASVPMVMLGRLNQTSLRPDEILIVMGLIYVFIRYGLSRVFKRFTVHRGMFHSIPAMFICGMLTYLAYGHPSLMVRIYVAIGASLGFFSHLLLDEFSSVDFRGVVPRLNKSAGSAIKFFSPSRWATCVCYFFLGAIGFLVWVDVEMRSGHSPWALIFGDASPW